MYAYVLTLALSATPESVSSMSATESLPSAPSPADSVVSAAFTTPIDTPAPNVQSSSAPPTIGLNNLIAPGVVLLGLAVMFALSRRRGTPGASTLRVVEAAAIGPKRSIVIAEVMGERLALGVSEAGITVLAKQAIPAPQTAAEVAFFAPPPPVVDKPMSFFERLRGKKPTVAFDERLRESIEDQELRAKLAAGMRGVVP